MRTKLKLLAQPDGEAKAKICFIHGFSDHINVYQDFFCYLSGRGIAVLGFDQRGWGRSVKKAADRGNTGPNEQVLSEVAQFVKQHIPGEGERQATPLFVMGHSMGGAIALNLATAPQHQDVVHKVRGWLLETPFIGFDEGEAPSFLKIAAGRMAGMLLPRFQITHCIPPEALTRDADWQDVIRNDELCHDTGTLQFFAALLDRAMYIDTGVIKVQKGQIRSLWLGSGNKDKAVGYVPQKKWYDGLGDEIEDKQMKVYDGWFHMLHREIGREEFFKDVADWVLARSEDAAAAADAADGKSRL